MKYKVLFVDDDPATLQLMVRVAGFLGHDALTASKVPDGMELIEREFPDLVIVDFNMKEIDGTQFVKQVRKNPDFKNIPIVIFSAEKTKQQVESARHAGANGFFLKPIPLDDMTRIIQHFTDPQKRKTRFETD
jgi:CheY-like chemotaxis protein